MNTCRSARVVACAAINSSTRIVGTTNRRADLFDGGLHQNDPLDRLQRRRDEPGNELAKMRSGEESQPESLDSLLLVFAPRLVAARVLVPERRRGFQLARHHRE